MITLLLIGNRVKSSAKHASIRPRRFLILSAIVLGLLALIFVAMRFLPQPSLAHSNTLAKPYQHGCFAHIPSVSRRMIRTFYTTEYGFESTLVLNNKGPNQIAVTPILHGQNGQSFTAQPVMVDGQASSEVDLNTLAISAGGSQFRSGSFEFTYTGRLLEIGGGLRIVNSEKSLIFDEQMLEPGMRFPSPRLEAVYAVPFDSAQVSVIVTNTTAEPLVVDGDATFEGLDGHHPINEKLGPYDTQVINLPHGLVKKTTAGAVSLNHTGNKGALLAMIHLQVSEKGYSETVNFRNPQGKTTQLHGAGLRLGTINDDTLSPLIDVRNIGDEETTITARMPYSKQNGDTGTIKLPQISLAPSEIKVLNTSNPQLRRNDFETAGLEIEYTGAPGIVITSASSVSQSGNHVFALPMKDPQGGLSSTGGYPWFINETSSTVVFIKNVTNEQQDFMLNIIYPGGQWSSNVRSLAPRQTFALDVRKLRDSQEKGADGSVFPPDASSGHVSWSYRGKQSKVLIGRAQTVDFANGLASTYECQCICGWTWANEARILPGSATGFPGDVGVFQIQSRYRDCHGSDMGWLTLDAYALNNLVTYSSDNPGVATFVAPATGTAIAPGSTYLRASWDEYYVNYDVHTDTCVEIAAAALCAALCDVQDCTRPTGELTNSVMWDNIAPTKRHFKQILQPANPPSFNGRSVTEQDPGGGGPDTCYFQTSAVPEFIKVSGGTWSVGSINDWGPDVIGWSPNSVSYYRMNGRAPCGTKFMQRMVINCPGSSLEIRPYVTHMIEATIGTTQVSASRAGVIATRNYP